MASTSRICGTFRNVTGSSVNRQAASRGNAAFLFPEGVTSPCNGTPPSITNSSIQAPLISCRIVRNPSHASNEMAPPCQMLHCKLFIIGIIMIFMTAAIIIPVFSGWLAGLCINYLADVLPRTRSFSRPHCPQCDAEFSVQDYLLLRACPQGHRRNLRTWLTQFAALTASLYIWIMPNEKLGYALGLILTIYFGVVFVIDL